MSRTNIWFPAGIDNRGIHWVQTDSQTLSDRSFLFGDVFRDRPVRYLPFGQKPDDRPAQQRRWPSRYIFHTAFCCSTLLARALRFPGYSIDIKEPDVLMQVANLERNHPGQTAGLLSHIEAALFSSDEPAIVKPTNAANRIAAALMQSGDARAIVIHSDLESFILAIARKGEAGRSFVRRLYNIFLMDDAFAAQLPPRDTFTLTDLQIAGFVWCMQCAQLNAAIAACPDRIRTVHSDIFLTHTETTLRAATDFLVLSVPSDVIRSQAQGELFHRDSKFPDQGFDAGLRREDKRNAGDAFSESLAYVKDWLEKLPHPKLISGPLLLDMKKASSEN